MLILGLCLALNLTSSGCCVISVSPPCSINGCYCDQSCFYWKDCCNDVADIGCHPTTPSFLTVSSTSKTKTDTLVTVF